MQNLFSYPVVVDELGNGEKKFHINTDAAQLEEIKEILKVPDVKSFSAEIMLNSNKKEHILKAWGKVSATLTLQSVISLDFFDKKYETDFDVFYDTKATRKEIREIELELDLDDDAPEAIINGKIDLANIAIEQLALILEDNPKKEGEVFSFCSEFDEETTKEMNPFAVLKKLKK